MMIKTNSHVAATITNVSICLLIGVSIYFTKSAWPLWGLFFLASSKTSNDENEEE